MAVAQMILDVLDELSADDFKRFQWNLTLPIMDECQPIRKVHLESATRQDTVTKMIGSYGEKSALELAVAVLKKMNHNNAAQQLMSTYQGAIESPSITLERAKTWVFTTFTTAFCFCLSSGSEPGSEPRAGPGPQGSTAMAPRIHGNNTNLNVNVNVNRD